MRLGGRGRGRGPAGSHQHFVPYSPRHFIARVSLAKHPRPISSKIHCTFLGPTLFFPPPRSLSPPKKSIAIYKKYKNTTMTEPPPPHDRPIVPHTRSPRTTPYRDMRTTPSPIPRMRDLTICQQPTQSGSSPWQGATMIG